MNLIDEKRLNNDWWICRMESFQECGVQMLREFRALMQHTPLPVNQTRLLQLLALNMFAVSNTQLIGNYHFI